jgi:hypothetical protein
MVFAASLHRGQLRKGLRFPYVSHLLAVTALVIETAAPRHQAIGRCSTTP